MTNPSWTMGGIFADEGITGTSARKRPEFLHMIRLCKQKKIDVVLTKSISRFARNTVDCLNYVRALKELGIAVIFEKENINTLESDSEMLITMLGAFAQAESESISANVRWGKRQAMREGKAAIQYKTLYAYEKGEDGKPKIVPSEAEAVREIYDRFLAGASLREIKTELEGRGILNVKGLPAWPINTIRSILTNEKYCGDVLLQKTYISDCINRKVVRNNGQLPKYLIQNHHERIVDRPTFDAAQAELARRSAKRSASQKSAPTGRSCYSAKYALTERLVCGECGTLYRRCTWARKGQKRIVWRCISRLDYGTKYCHNSPTMEEAVLQKTILAAINSAMSDKGEIIRKITEAIETELVPIAGETMSIAAIERKLGELEARTHDLLVKASESGGYAEYASELKAIMEEASLLKGRKAYIQEQIEANDAAVSRVRQAVQAMQEAPVELTEWNESTIRQLVDTVKVISKERLEVILHSGVRIQQDVIQ